MQRPGNPDPWLLRPNSQTTNTALVKGSSLIR